MPIKAYEPKPKHGRNEESIKTKSMKRHLSELLSRSKAIQTVDFPTSWHMQYNDGALVKLRSHRSCSGYKCIFGDHITSRGEAINGSKLAEKLGAIDTSKGTELAVLHDTPAVRETIVAICSLCEQKSKPIPRIIADADTAASIKGSLPEGSAVSRMDAVSLDATNLVFVSELDLDGLFGFSTTAVKLLRKFGKEEMLSAYTKRAGNTPTPGRLTKCSEVADNFTNKFEIQSVEIIANAQGVLDVDSRTSFKDITNKQKIRTCIKYRDTKDWSPSGQYWKIIKQPNSLTGIAFNMMSTYAAVKNRRSCSIGRMLQTMEPLIQAKAQSLQYCKIRLPYGRPSWQYAHYVSKNQNPYRAS